MHRRDFLHASLHVSLSAGGLLLGLSLPGCHGAAAPPPASPHAPPPGQAEVPAGVVINAWILIAPDDWVTLRVNRSEMGQGVYTALPMILAEELEADWSKVRSEHAPVEPGTYGDQATRLSNAVMDNYAPLRRAGAAAREMLIAAAARRWNVDSATCRAERSAVLDASGRRLRYGELLAEAAAMPVPESPKLKPESSFRLIGKATPRLDSPDKLEGKAIFGIDVKVPDMLTAVVARCPIFGGSLQSFDARAARAVPGVLDVVRISSGIAVVAESFWAAKKGRDALVIEWDPGSGAGLSTASIFQALRDAVDHGKEAQRRGNPAAALARAKRKLDAIYEVPYLPAAPMEPLGCTADVRAGSCDVWAATQVPVFTQKAVAEMTGLPLGAVRVHVTQLGGGFGRRKQLDFVLEAVELSKARRRPIKVIWTREDDIRGGLYRPAASHRLLGAVDAKGRPIAWIHRIAAQPLPSVFETTVQDGIDAWAIQGADLPYAIPDMQVTYAMPRALPVTPWFWRAIGSSYNAYVTECFFDELCALSGRDPLAARLELLSGAPRHRRVLERAAKEARWGSDLPAGRAHGLAVHASFGSFCAQVAEVSIEAGKVRVHKVVCVIDCGGVVNPDTVVAQMEGSIVYALSAALYGKIDIEQGRAVQSNYSDYKILRLPETPVIETHIIAEGDPLGGVGEPGLPPTAPAVCNALRVLTGKPVRRLPINA